MTLPRRREHTGTLASGDIEGVFYQGGWEEHPCSAENCCSGTITLAYAPEPSQTLLYTSALATLALLRRRVLHGRERTC